MVNRERPRDGTPDSAHACLMDNILTFPKLFLFMMDKTKINTSTDVFHFCSKCLQTVLIVL